MKRPSLAALVMAFALAAASTSTLAAHAQDSSPYVPLASGEAVGARDALQVMDVIARMNGAIDTNDYPLYASYYLEDGVIDSGFGPPVTGRAAIIASLEASAPFITNKRHAATNIALEKRGPVIVATYYLLVFERQSGLNLAGTALIVDEFRRTGRDWRVVRHTTRMDPATIAAMTATMSATQPPR